MSDTDDKREQINYISVDSAPKRFAGHVAQSQAPMMLAVFTILAVVQLWTFNTDPVSAVFPNRDFVFSPHEGRHAIAIRIFLISFFISFAAFSNGGAKARILFGLRSGCDLLAGLRCI